MRRRNHDRRNQFHAPPQLYSVIAVLIFLLGAVLVVRKVFNYATTEELVKMEAGIRLELAQIRQGIKEELEKQTIERHQMRHEVTRIEVALGKVETKIESNTERLVSINGKIETLLAKAGR